VPAAPVASPDEPASTAGAAEKSANDKPAEA
jgi:hypothetical protein